MFSHSIIEEHFGYFELLTTADNAAPIICVQVCVDTNFQISGINTQECDCWVVLQVLPIKKKTGLFVFLLYSFQHSLFIMDTSPLLFNGSYFQCHA